MSNGVKVAQPKLTAEQIELVRWLQADQPGFPVRFAECTGPQGDPHPSDLYLGFMATGLCGTCAAELPTEVLDLKQVKGDGGGNGK